MSCTCVHMHVAPRLETLMPLPSKILHAGMHRASASVLQGHSLLAKVEMPVAQHPCARLPVQVLCRHLHFTPLLQFTLAS